MSSSPTSSAAEQPTSSASPTTSPSDPPTTTATATTTTSAQPINAHVPPLQQTLPSQETERHVAEARAAVVASMGNLLDSELQSRASNLHANASALQKQERDVVRATENLQRERQKLAREADVATRTVKELGNVQNWAEVLERGFLVLEETVRLANQDSDACSSDGSCTCSECASASEDETDADADADYAQGRMDVDVDLANSLHRQNNPPSGKANGAREDIDMDMENDRDRPPANHDCNTDANMERDAEGDIPKQGDTEQANTTFTRLTTALNPWKR